MKRMFFMVLSAMLLLAVPARAGNFTDNGDSTVTDSATGLMWQQTEGGSMTWEQALTYCEDLTLANYAGWRLPNVRELASLVDVNPTIDKTAFPNAVSSGYWSSTTYARDSSRAWFVSFDLGNVGSDGKSSSSDVRCVR